MPKKLQTIKKSSEFKLVKEKSRELGSVVVTPYFVLSYFKPNDYDGDSKFGFIVSKNFSKSAVKRNKARRILKELVRNNLQSISTSYFIVLIPRKRILEDKHEEISSVFNKTVQSNPISR